MKYKLCDLVVSANTGADAIKRAPILQEKTNLRCLRIGDVSQGREYEQWGFTKTSTGDYQKYRLHDGDILVARTGNTIGVNKYIEGNLEAVYNNGLIKIEADSKKIIPKYLYYIVRSKECQDYIQAIAYGTSTQPNMKIKDFLNFECDLLDIVTQNKIVNIINAIEKKFELNQKINNNLEQQALALYSSMFLENAELQTTPGTLKDIADITMGQSPGGTSYNESGDGEVFYQGRAEFGSRFPTRRLYTTEPKRMAEAGDVLLSVRAPVGDLNIAYERCCIGRGLGALHSKTGHSSFVLYTMFALQPQLNVFNGEGTVFGSINRNALNDMPISVPSSDVIDSFEAAVRPMDELIRSNYEENCRLQELRDSLLPRLISGEVDVSDILL